MSHMGHFRTEPGFRIPRSWLFVELACHSMTHDIIVKQHGGKIDVATEPGQFTEFTIVLPRKSNVSGKDRGGT